MFFMQTKGVADKPKVVLWDLETLPNLKEAMKVFAKLSNYPGLTMKATHNSIICFGYKELGDKYAKCINAWDFKSRWDRDINDDYDIVLAAYNILIDADCIVTQNGKSFDWKFLQTRLLHHKLKPLPKIQHIDTKHLAKSNLFLFNNSLSVMADFMTDTEKMDSGGWDLWNDVYLKDKKAMAKMERYCKQDVEALEHVFKRLLPFVKDMPNYNMFRRDAAPCCPNCGGFHLVKNGIRTRKARRVQRFLCVDCGTNHDCDAKGVPKTL